jgi:hypothetical protein
MGGQGGSPLPVLAPFFTDGAKLPAPISSIRARSINAILSILIALSLNYHS